MLAKLAAEREAEDLSCAYARLGQFRISYLYKAFRLQVVIVREQARCNVAGIV